MEEGVYRAYTTDEKMNIYQKETQNIMKYISNPVKIGHLILGGGAPIVVQTMCNTHTSDVEASFCQCARLAEAGAQMIRLTVPSLAQVDSIAEIRSRLRSNGIDVPIVADVETYNDRLKSIFSAHPQPLHCRFLHRKGRVSVKFSNPFPKRTVVHPDT